MTKTIRWGIVGTGAIAHKFAAGLDDLPDTALVAVGSRSQETADAFANEFGVARRHASYEALANDPDVDVVYISTPHVFHRDNTLMCLNAGKAVLCEKPFAINAGEVSEMIDTAREKGLFLMEAVWTRFLPHMLRVHDLISEGAIGNVRMLQADFGFRMGSVDPDHRLFNRELGGGALLDVGVYTVMLARQLFGQPSEIKSFANLGTTGVDEEAAVLMQHAKGELALLATGIQLETPQEATIMGTEGFIRLHEGWWHPSSFTLHRKGEEPELFEPDCPLNGYNYEALEVGRCLREGRLESDTMPLDESLAVTKTLDAIRAQWGLRYPVEG